MLTIVLSAPTYGVYISIRYSRTCGSYQDFLDRWLLLTRKLLNQGFLLVKLKSSLRMFYGRHPDLVDHYGISVSQMTTDMFHLSQTLPGPFLIRDFLAFQSFYFERTWWRLLRTWWRLLRIWWRLLLIWWRLFQKRIECTKFDIYIFLFIVIGIVIRLTRRVPLVEQELLTIPEHLSLPPVFSGVRVTRSLV